MKNRQRTNINKTRISKEEKKNHHVGKATNKQNQTHQQELTAFF